MLIINPERTSLWEQTSQQSSKNSSNLSREPLKGTMHNSSENQKKGFLFRLVIPQVYSTEAMRSRDKSKYKRKKEEEREGERNPREEEWNKTVFHPKLRTFFFLSTLFSELLTRKHKHTNQTLWKKYIEKIYKVKANKNRIVFFQEMFIIFL